MIKQELGQTLKLLIVDDHQILIDGLFNMLDQSYYQIVDQAHNAGEALEILEQKEVDLLVCDLEMPGMPGIDLIRIIKERYPHIKILVLSMHDEKSIVTEAVKLGINGYLLKNISQDKLLQAIERARHNKFYISEELTDILAENISTKSPKELLTVRELEILKLIVNEHTNKEIAKTLFISERTVESHRKNIFRKTNSKSLVGLIKYTIDNKLI
ncbi:MAG: response regulator transcription factor [Bacteroidales bacterium]|nr:response regulator transcription factor [Bacteroidales bacterium]